MTAETRCEPEPPVERSALMEMVALAAPVVATMTSFTLMQFADKLMVSRIGPDPIYVGAQGNGGLVSWVPISIAHGMVAVVNTYVSQHLGAGTPREGARYVWASGWISLVFWLVVLVPIALCVPWVFGLSHGGLGGETLARAEARDAMASSYAQILLFGGVITLTTRCVSQYFYGLHRPAVVMVASIVGNVVNLIGNSFLIYGPVAPTTGVGWLDAWFQFTAGVCQSLGIERMGVAGSAYATLFATMVELSISGAVFVFGKRSRELRTCEHWRPSLKPMKEVASLGWPGALMFGNEMICWALFMVYLVGQFGTNHSTAGWIAHQYMSLSFMPTVGISVAITAMVGKAMGMGRPDVAAARAWLGMRVAAAWMTLCAIVFVVFREGLIRSFVDRATEPAVVEELVKIGSGFLIATAAFQFFDGIAMSLSGALRGAGDTRWPGVVTVVLSWVFVVGGGFALVKFWPALGSIGPWAAAASYIIVLSFALVWRFRAGHWRSIKLVDKPAS
jgi:multidrug resistance protein, MATE family